MCVKCIHIYTIELYLCVLVFKSLWILRSSHGFSIASHTRHHPLAQVSLLATARSATSSCTGIYTSDMGLAVAMRVINQSGLLEGHHVHIATQACWDSRQNNMFNQMLKTLYLTPVQCNEMKLLKWGVSCQGVSCIKNPKAHLRNRTRSVGRWSGTTIGGVMM